MFNNIDLAIYKIEYLIVTLEQLIINNCNQSINIVCNPNYITIKVPPAIISNDLDMELEFMEDENDLYEYMAIRLITTLYSKGIMVNNNIIYNYFSHPKLMIIINDSKLLGLVSKIIMAKHNFDDKKVKCLVAEKRKCLKRRIKKQIDIDYLEDLDNGTDNIETIFRREGYE